MFEYNKSRLTYVSAVKPNDFGTVCHHSSIAGKVQLNETLAVRVRMILTDKRTSRYGGHVRHNGVGRRSDAKRKRADITVKALCRP